MKSRLLTVTELVQKIKSSEITAVEHTKKILEEIKKSNSKYNFFNAVSQGLALKQAKEIDERVKNKTARGELLGVPVSAKDCICVKGVQSTAGSKILAGYKPVFDAAVIERAKKEGAIIIGKTSQDEFGFGTFSTNTQNVPLNPNDPARSCGGSSGGSAGFTAFTGFCHVSIAESTGGSIACPASFCGTIGFTPTYGRVSRRGLMDYASSLDKIGCTTKTVKESALLMKAISGFDSKESTTLPQKVENYSAINSSSAKKMEIGIVKEFFSGEIDKKVSGTVWNAIKKLEGEGVKFSEVSLPLNAKHGITAYYLIAVSEASTNLAKYCGMRYGLQETLRGNFDEYFSKVRSKGFTKEAKRRIILGTFARMSGFRDAYYLRAMKVRTKLMNEFKQVFKKFDLLVHPTMPIVAPKFSEIKNLPPIKQYYMDLCTVPANLAGLPHISVNVGKAGFMPVGAMFTGNYLQEKKLFETGALLEACMC